MVQDICRPFEFFLVTRLFDSRDYLFVIKIVDLVFTEGKVEQTSTEEDSELSSHSIPYHTG